MTRKEEFIHKLGELLAEFADLPRAELIDELELMRQGLDDEGDE